MAITIFFDDGGVINDNNIRGQQWKKFVGEYYSARFGGDSEVWGEANHKLINLLFDIFWRDGKENFDDYQSFYNDFKKNMVLGMFKEVGKIPPKEINVEEVYNSASQYVIPKVRSAIPGVIDSIKQLFARGFILYTASGAVSIEMKMYLDGLGVSQYFVEFYGPDLINTWKSGPNYYKALFNHSRVDPTKAIIIDDQPRFLYNALNEGTNIIQACITGQHEPQFPYFVEDMRDLVPTIEKLIKSLNL
jgi:phosphoglycolate phosphatase-like HAD superfamily hydrolase